MSGFGKAQSKAEHRRIKEMLSVYIDGELPPGDRARVEEHLAECAECAWELETLRQTVELVGQLPKVPVPHAFTIYEAPRPRWVSLFQAKWAYTYLKGATALAAALLILVLVGDVLFLSQRAAPGFAPAMAPAKELAAPAAAPTVVAMQEAPLAPTEAPGPPEEVLDEAEGAAYAEVAPSPPPGEEAEAPAPMPTPAAPAAIKGGGPTARDGATPTPLATPAPMVDKARATDTPAPSIAMEAPVEEAPQAPVALAATLTATPQPQMTATSIPGALLAPVSAAPSATPTPLAIATATATATSAPTATPISMARAPSEARPTEKRHTLAEPPARPPRLLLTPLRVVEASLCLLVIILIAATLIVRQRSKP
jgi:hypothetical protein